MILEGLITLQMLLNTIDTLPLVPYLIYKATLYQCAFLLVCFTFPRVSEAVAIQSDCVQLVENQVILLITSSKTDQM